MMTLVFTKENGKRKVINTQGDQATISKGCIMDDDVVIAVCVMGGFVLASDWGVTKGRLNAKMYDTLEITQGEEG